jgi:putative transposase
MTDQSIIVEPLCIRTYNHQVLDLNISKVKQVHNILVEYRRVASIILNKQLVCWFKSGKISKEAKQFYGNIDTFLSERYKDVIKRQVDGILKSYISNRKNDFKKLVYNSSLSDEIKKELYLINNRHLWFQTDNKLARKILKETLKNNRFPRVKNINMCLNTKVYKLEKIDNSNSSYQVLLNTCLDNKEDKWLPLTLKTNSLFEQVLKQDRRELKINNSIQLNFNKNKQLTNVGLVISFAKYNEQLEKEEDKYISKTDVIALDFGLVNLFTTNHGDMYSKNFIKKLKYYDSRIQKLTKELKVRDSKCRLRENKRYNQMQKDLRDYIDNEINRVLNRIVKVYKPKRIIMEDLEFREQKLSKRLNRILSNCGLSRIKSKSQSLSEQYGIEFTFINPCDTSRQCVVCDYTDKKNRKTRDKFDCQCCGHKALADVNATRVFLKRDKDTWFQSNKIVSRAKIHQHLKESNDKWRVFSGRTSSCTQVGKVKALSSEDKC